MRAPHAATYHIEAATRVRRVNILGEHQASDVVKPTLLNERHSVTAELRVAVEQHCGAMPCFSIQPASHARFHGCLQAALSQQRAFRVRR